MKPSWILLLKHNLILFLAGSAAIFMVYDLWLIGLFLYFLASLFLEKEHPTLE